jgi:hypothetical protein
MSKQMKLQKQFKFDKFFFTTTYRINGVWTPDLKTKQFQIACSVSDDSVKPHFLGGNKARWDTHQEAIDYIMELEHQML